MSDELILVVDGTPHYGWKDLAVTRGIEQGPHAFEVSLTERWDAKNSIKPRAIQAGMECQVFVNDDQILTGYVDDIDPEYDAKTHTIAVRGRSKVGDLVDCSTTGSQAAKGRSLTDIATSLCKPFGISVVVDASAADAAKQVFVSSNMLDNGQPIWEFLEELARIRAVLLISDSNGNLVITRAGTGRADVALELGVNIKSASGSFSHRELFSEYTVTGQQAGGGLLDTTATSQSIATQTGDSSRHRPFVISSDNPADIAACKARAQWQRNVHYGRSRGTTYTVTGWRQQPGGRIWTPNELVPVNDEWSGLYNEHRLIVESRLQLSSQSGSVTQLRTMPKEAFDLVPVPEVAAEAW